MNTMRAMLVVLLLVCAGEAVARTWTDSTGEHKIEAEFVRVDQSQVYLKKTDGTVIAVPLQKMSPEDRKYVASLRPTDDSGTKQPEDADDGPSPHVYRLNGPTPELQAADLARYKDTIHYLANERDGLYVAISVDEASHELLQIIAAAVRADIPDRTLLALLRAGVAKGKGHDLDSFISTRVVRQSLEFVTSLGFRGGATGARTNDIRRASVDWDTLQKNDELLRFQAASSSTYDKLAATVRIGVALKYKEGTEAAEIMKAIGEGRTTYTYKAVGRRPAITMSICLDERRWSQVVVAGSGVNKGMIASLRMQAGENAKMSRDYPLIALTRNLQWGTDISLQVRRQLAASAGSTVRRDQRLAYQLGDLLIMSLAEVEYTEFRGHDKLLAAIMPILSDKMAANRVRVAEKDLTPYAGIGLGDIGTVARRKGYEGLEHLLDLHDPKHLFAVSSCHVAEEDGAAIDGK